jgi:hypothetical protein
LVINVATKEQRDAAIVAVRNGVADRRQEEIAAAAAKQAGAVGNTAREAFKGK